MESKEKRALNKFADEIIRDLEPSPTFLHSLYTRNVLNEEHLDIIGSISSREQKVTKILQILPRRGPEAFTVFKSCLTKDYHWLESKLTNEVRRLKEGQMGINRKFVSTIELKLDPLIYSEEEEVEKCSESTHPNNIVKKLNNSLTDLETRCYKALSVTIGPKKVPIPQLIEKRLREETKLEELTKSKNERDNKGAEETAALTQTLKTEKVQLQERLTVINKNLGFTEAILVPLVYNEPERVERGTPPSSKSTSNIKRINETIIEHQQRCLKALDIKLTSAKLPIHTLISRRLREERGKESNENTERSKDMRKMSKQCDETKKENDNLKKRMDYLRDKQKQLIRTSKELKNCQQENAKLRTENTKMREELAAIQDKPREGACITSLFG